LVVLGLGRHDPGASVVGWLEPLGPADRVLATIGAVAVGLLAALTILVGWLLVQQRQLLARLGAIEAQLEEGTPAAAEREHARPPDKGLPIGAPAPPFVLPDLAGAPRALSTLLEARRPVLLVFGSAGCDPCAALLPELVRWQREHAPTMEVVVVSSGTPDENRQKLAGLAADRVLLQADSEVADAYAAQWTPGAVLIARTGRIASAGAYGDQAIRALVARAVAAPDVPVVGSPEARGDRGALSIVRSGGPPRLGDPAPPLSRPGPRRPRARSRRLPRPRHARRVLAAELPPLPAASGGPPPLGGGAAPQRAAAPDRLLRIGRREPGARIQVVARPRRRIPARKAFGARGTPSAVLVDAEGRIASTVAVGARDVLALAGLLPPIRARGAAPSA
jgi:cytochrome oxidase Cu insertion factor (SCO1/SenC/PrrC family)